jgi:hypothetical protein
MPSPRRSAKQPERRGTVDRKAVAEPSSENMIGTSLISPNRRLNRQGSPSVPIERDTIGKLQCVATKIRQTTPARPDGRSACDTFCKQICLLPCANTAESIQIDGEGQLSLDNNLGGHFACGRFQISCPGQKKSGGSEEHPLRV